MLQKFSNSLFIIVYHSYLFDKIQVKGLIILLNRIHNFKGYFNVFLQFLTFPSDYE